MIILRKRFPADFPILVTPAHDTSFPVDNGGFGKAISRADLMKPQIIAADFGVSPSATATVNDAALVAAQTALTNLGGGCMQLPAGDIQWGQPLIIPPGHKIIGQGKDITTLHFVGAEWAGGAIKFGMGASPVGDIRLAHLHLFAAGRSLYGVEVGKLAFGNLIEDIRVSYSLSYAIYLHDLYAFELPIEKCDFLSCGAGIYAGIEANCTHISGCSFAYITGPALHFYRATNWIVEKSVISLSGTDPAAPYAVLIEGGWGFNLNHCYLEQNGDNTAGSADIMMRRTMAQGCQGALFMGNYWNGTECCGHAIIADYDPIQVIGGMSWRHIGTTYLETNGAVISDLGLTVNDPGGKR